MLNRNIGNKKTSRQQRRQDATKRIKKRKPKRAITTEERALLGPQRHDPDVRFGNHDDGNGLATFHHRRLKGRGTPLGLSIMKNIVNWGSDVTFTVTKDKDPYRRQLNVVSGKKSSAVSIGPARWIISFRSGWSKCPIENWTLLTKIATGINKNCQGQEIMQDHWHTWAGRAEAHA